MADTIRTDLILGHSTVTHVLTVPIEKVDISRWLFNLPEGEYQRCAPSEHITAGFTTTDDGRPVSINVEMVDTYLLIQHFVGEIIEKLHCRLRSLSDVITPEGRSRVLVIWEISMKEIGDGRSKYTNAITAHPTEAFLDSMKERGVTFEQVSQTIQAGLAGHNSRETPLFAESIARAARINN